MARAMFGIGALLLASLAAAQEGDPTMWEAFAPYEKAVRAIAGVQEITLGPVNGERGFLIRVSTAHARDTVKIMFGERLNGYPLHVFMGTSPGKTMAGGCLHCPIHCGPGSTVADPSKGPGTTKIDMTRLNDPAYAQERCDIIRRWIGLPKLTGEEANCQEMLTTTNNHRRIMWVISQGIPHWKSQEMPSIRGSDLLAVKCPEHGTHNQGEFVAYAWIKHRQFCPLGMKQVLKEIEDQTPLQGPRK